MKQMINLSHYGFHLMEKFLFNLPKRCVNLSNTDEAVKFVSIL